MHNKKGVSGATMVCKGGQDYVCCKCVGCNNDEMGPSGNLSPTLAMNFLHYTTPFPPKKAGAAVKGVRENPGSMCDVLLCVILTELAAAAAENCTTIADLSAK